MQKLATGMPVRNGFTLIEILIVIVIIGITMGFALVAFGDFGADKRILFSAEQLLNNLKTVQQQAILESSTLGLRINQESYQIVKYQDDWHVVSNKGIYKVFFFPKNTKIILQTNTQNQSNTPAIVINASGDITPFTLQMGTKDNPAIATITANYNGSLLFNTVKKQ